MPNITTLMYYRTVEINSMIRRTLKANLDIADVLFSKTTTPAIVLYTPLLTNEKFLRSQCRLKVYLL